MISVTLAVLVEDARYRQFLMALFHFYSPVYFSHILETTLMCAYAFLWSPSSHTHFHLRLHTQRLALQPPYLLCYLIDCLDDCFIKSRGRLAERGEGLLLLSQTAEVNLKKQDKTC